MISFVSFGPSIANSMTLWRTVRRRLTSRTKSLTPKQKAYRAYKEEARNLLVPLVQQQAERIGVTYGRIAIKDTRRSWGSCSAKGNLNFHYKLLFLPEHLTRYVVIHELCHRKHLNHSQEFWDEVALWCDDVAGCRQELRYIERHIGMARERLLSYQANRQASVAPYLMQSTPDVEQSAILAGL
jgi:predicted metal-dependent hydrolase